MSEITDLTATLNSFIEASASRSVRLETNQEHLTSAVTEMTQAHKEIMTSNAKLEEKICSLESKAVDRLTVIDKTITEVKDQQRKNTEKVGMLELNMATQAAEEKVKDSYKKWWSANWSKIFMTFIVTVPLTVSLYNLVKKMG
jgi:Tfp pilus assembly major pilin PilA